MPCFPVASLIQLKRAMKLLQLIFLILFFPFQSDPAAVKATLAVIIGSSLQNKEMEFETPFVQSGLQSREALKQKIWGQVALLASECPNRLGCFVIPFIFWTRLPSYGYHRHDAIDKGRVCACCAAHAGIHLLPAGISQCSAGLRFQSQHWI